MKMVIIIIIFSIMIAYAVGFATIINIPADYPAIQEGIDASTDGDTVLVQPGTYYENILFNGHSITLGSLFLMTGDTTFIAQTIIDGDDLGSVITLESGLAIITGLTIQNGYSMSGAGIHCSNNSNIFLRNNLILHNFSEAEGGTIYLQGNSNGLINGNRIIGNNALSGGGIASDSSNISVTNNLFMWNGANRGSSIYSAYSDVLLVGNIFARGSAYWGGTIVCFRSPLVVINNTITNNNTSYGGAAIDGFESAISVSNTICWGNEVDQEGGEIIGEFCDVQISYSNIGGGWSGPGNIDTNPLFRDPDNGDFHLMSTACGDPYDSPCIDTGSPDIIDSQLDCSWGLGTVLSDMGAYGGGDSATVGIDDYTDLIPENTALLQNFPNPFNASTTIRFTLPQPTDITIEIYNILGQRVEVLFEGNKLAGSHSVTWNADNHPSGLYFARMTAGERTENIKMVLIK